MRAMNPGKTFGLRIPSFPRVIIGWVETRETGGVTTPCGGETGSSLLEGSSSLSEGGGESLVCSCGSDEDIIGGGLGHKRRGLGTTNELKGELEGELVLGFDWAYSTDPASSKVDNSNVASSANEGESAKGKLVSSNLAWRVV